MPQKNLVSRASSKKVASRGFSGWLKTSKLNQKGFGHHIIMPILVVGAVAAIGAYVVVKSHAAGVITGTLQGESMNVTQGNGTKVSDVNANGKQALKLTYAAPTASAIATGSIDVSATSDKLVLTAKAEGCSDAGNVKVAVQGQTFISAEVVGSTYVHYPDTSKTLAGPKTYAITVTYTKAASCTSGSVYVDFVRVRSQDNIPPPPAEDCKNLTPPSGYTTLAFCDGFDGAQVNDGTNGTPDYWSYGWAGSGDWTANGTGTDPVQSQELECYSKSQVSVSGGQLHLGAIAQTPTCKDGKNRPYTAGAIGSHTKEEYTHGYFEAKIWNDGSCTRKSDGKPGICNWNAWWLDNLGWPANGELDIMESLSGHLSSHWHGGPGGGSSAFNISDRNLVPGEGYMPGWHTFAADWQKGKVTAIYDGKSVGTFTSSVVGTSPQFLNLMLQISPEDNYGGPVKVPNHMDVEYVRVWQ